MFDKKLYVQKFVIVKNSGKLENVSQIDLATALLDLEVEKLNKVYGEVNNLQIIKDAFSFEKDNKKMIYVYIGESK